MTSVRPSFGTCEIVTEVCVYGPWNVQVCILLFAPPLVIESVAAIDDRERRIIEVQFQNVKSNDLAQFKDPKTEVVLYPPSLKNGEIIYPYPKARE